MKFFPVLVIAILTATFGICQENLPLTAPEKRQIAEQLNELEALRAKVAEYKKAIQELTNERQEAKQTCKDAIDAEKEIGKAKEATLQKEIELERSNAAFYKEQYEILLKKRPSFGCIVKRIFTLGMARCGS